MTAYPEHNWMPWKFNQVSQGYWNSKDNQRKFFDWLGRELGVKELDDWYSVLTTRVLVEHGGTFIRFYNGSASEALMSCYPEHTWIPWKFNGQQRFWSSIQNQRRFFDWLGKNLGVKQPNDWYSRLSLKTILENGGSFVARHYNNSAIEALKASYPEINWIPWKFKHAPHNLWKSKETQRKFFDWLATELGVKQLDDWYGILKSRVVLAHGGEFVKTVYNGSVTEALVSCYPEHSWDLWKFQQSAVPRGYWNSHDNISRFLAELSEKLCIQTLDDWYRVDLIQLQKFGASHIINRCGGLYEILKNHYPAHPWQRSRFHCGKKAQRWLIVNLRKLYPGEDIIEDYTHPKAVYPDTQRPMQLDAFMPAKSLAFEYQGQQHYQDVPLFQPQKLHQGRDLKKRRLCAEHNITVVEVPYWWNRTLEGLQEIIAQATQI